MGTTKMVTFEGYLLRTTARAVLFHGHYWGGALWLPMSQIEMEPDGDLGAVVVKVRPWLTSKKGLMEFSHYSAEEIEGMNA